MYGKVQHRGYFLLLALLLLLSACDMPDEEGYASSAAGPMGDLDGITERGTLRALRPQLALSEHLPRKGFSLDFEVDLIDAYARSRGLELEWVYVDSHVDLFAALLDGRGDLIAGNLTVTEARKQEMLFTVPVAIAREQVVTRIDDDTIESIGDLVGRRIAIRPSSSFRATVDELLQAYPGIEIEDAPERFDTEEIIRRVASGDYDLTVADSNLVQAVLGYRSDVRSAIDLTDDRPIAWAVRPTSRKLLRDLNMYLTEAHLTTRVGSLATGDLDAIATGHVLRVLTRNNAASYFLYRGELVGFEYEFIREFARQQGLRLEIVVPPNSRDLLPWLVEGRGDIIAAAMTPTAGRRAQGVSFSKPYNFVSQVLVARSDEEELRGPLDLDGRQVVVRRSSEYWTTLEQLRFSGVDFELIAAPEELETNEIIAHVAAGAFDLTVADSNTLDLELTWRDDIKGAFALTEEKPQAWAVRGINPELLAAVDEFIDREYRGLFYNVIYDRYFRDERRIRRHRAERASHGGELSPYDALVRRYAEQYGFDWRLIVAVMYQESRFDPEAQSFAGARGLMQILPRTAEQLGFEDELAHDPEAGIHAGIRYLAWVRDRFDDELPVRDRMWFTLAAYNAGFGHVNDARRIAAEEGLNPNRWFGNVERAMMLLSRPQYAQNARFGYCRCAEPVNYVREILNRYNAYLESTELIGQNRASL
jgi:membrane-bound lytic murein transglycosylase F